MLSIVILAGGQSSRMGSNKALLPFSGKPLITRVVERLRSLGSEILIAANDQDGFDFLGLPLVADILPGNGTLGGLHTALKSAAHDLVAVVACDMPFVSPEMLIYQRELLVREKVDVVLPSTVNGLEPLHAVYRRETCLPAIEEALQEGQRRLISWFPSVKVRVLTDKEVISLDPDQRAFININTPEELAAAVRMDQSEEG